MLELLIALQVTTTTCRPDYIGGYRCTTNVPQQAPRVEMRRDPDSDSGIVLGTAIRDLIDGTGERRVRSRVGKMLAAGDCDGALKYALEKGHLELAEQVAALCLRSTAP